MVGIYLNEIGKASFSTFEKNYELAAILQACKKELEDNLETNHLTEERKAELEECQLQARNQITVGNLRLVVKVVKPLRHTTHHLSFLDLIQAGNEGLMTAAEKFDPRKGFRFATYARNWILNATSKAIIDFDHGIRLPRNVETHRLAVRRCRDYLTQDLGRRVSHKEVADFLGLGIEQIEQYDTIGQSVDSLEYLLDSGDGAYLRALAAEDPEATDVFQRIVQAEEAEMISNLLGYLEPSERAVLDHYHYRGFCEEDVLPSLDEVSRRVGLSRDVARSLAVQARSKFLRLFYGQRPGGPPAAAMSPENDSPAVIEFEYEDDPAMTEVAESRWRLKLASSNQPPADTAWLKQGPCLDFDLNDFYPGRGASTHWALAICSGCPSKTPCLEHALQHNYPGIWGATTGRMRRKITNHRLKLGAQSG